MAALTAAEARTLRNVEGLKRGRLAVKTGSVIYQGSLVSMIKSTGRAIASTAATGRAFVGIAKATVTGNTGGSVYVDLYWGCEAKIDKAAALTKAYTFADAFVSDDQTVTTGTGAGSAAIQTASRVGTMTEIDGSSAWVWIRGFSNKAT